MTDVKLTTFRFALPVMVKQKCESGELISEMECPHEFFGLPEKEQVSVLHGLLCAVVRQVERLKKTGSVNKAALDDCLPTQSFPLHVGLSVCLKKQPSLSMDAGFYFPDNWAKTICDKKIQILNSIAYLLQTATLAIVGRQMKKESV